MSLSWNNKDCFHVTWSTANYCRLCVWCTILIVLSDIFMSSWWRLGDLPLKGEITDLANGLRRLSYYWPSGSIKIIFWSSFYLSRSHLSGRQDKKLGQKVNVKFFRVNPYLMCTRVPRAFQNSFIFWVWIFLGRIYSTWRLKPNT